MGTAGRSGGPRVVSFPGLGVEAAESGVRTEFKCHHLTLLKLHELFELQVPCLFKWGKLRVFTQGKLYI